VYSWRNLAASTIEDYAKLKRETVEGDKQWTRVVDANATDEAGVRSN